MNEMNEKEYLQFFILCLDGVHIFGDWLELVESAFCGDQPRADFLQIVVVHLLGLPAFLKHLLSVVHKTK